MQFYDSFIIYFQFDCCGIHNYTDWFYVLGENKDNDVTLGCCIDKKKMGNECHKDIKNKPLEEIKKIIHTEGCKTTIIDSYQSFLLSITITSFISCIFPVSNNYYHSFLQLYFPSKY